MGRKFAVLAFMWRIVPVLAVVALSSAELAQAPLGHIRHYIQLIPAADSSQPPQTGSRPVGAKLATAFHGALRWKTTLHYFSVLQILCPDPDTLSVVP